MGKKNFCGKKSGLTGWKKPDGPTTAEEEQATNDRGRELQKQLTERTFIRRRRRAVMMNMLVKKFAAAEEKRKRKKREKQKNEK